MTRVCTHPVMAKCGCADRLERVRIALLAPQLYADDLRPGGILFVPDPPDWTPIKYLGVAFVSCALGFGAACWVLL